MRKAKTEMQHKEKLLKIHVGARVSDKPKALREYHKYCTELAEIRRERVRAKQNKNK